MSGRADHRELKPESAGERSPATGRGLRAVPASLLVCCALALAGCESGAIGGTELRCESSGGLFASGEVSCAGSADRASGTAGLVLADTDGVRSGEYRLEAVISAERGSTAATVETVSGEEAGGVVTPENPLRLGATVEVDDDRDLAATLRVRGEEVRGLAHEATLTPR